MRKNPGAGRASAQEYGCVEIHGEAKRGKGMTFYDRKLVRMTAVTPEGDDVRLQLPVAAVKRLINQAGKLPLPDDMVQGIDTAELIEIIGTCFEAETEGELLNVSASNGAKFHVSIGD